MVLYISITTINRLNLFSKIIAVSCDNHTKDKYTVYENANVQRFVLIVTAVFLSVIKFLIVSQVQ